MSDINIETTDNERCEQLRRRYDEVAQAAGRADGTCSWPEAFGVIFGDAQYSDTERVRLPDAVVSASVGRGNLRVRVAQGAADDDRFAGLACCLADERWHTVEREPGGYELTVDARSPEQQAREPKPGGAST